MSFRFTGRRSSITRFTELTDKQSFIMNGSKNLADLIDPSQDLDRIAIIDLLNSSTPRCLTYRELDMLIGGVAVHLTALGLPRGARVAILSSNRVEYIAAYLGTMRAGYVSVPVNIKLPAQTIAHVLSDADVGYAFVDEARKELLESSLPFVNFDDASQEGFAALVKPAKFDAVMVEPSDVAQILYTSGSTGRPKGVPLTHSGMLWALNKPLPPNAKDARQIVAQPLFHMNGLMVMKDVVRSSASLVVMPGFDTEKYTEALSQWEVTRVFAVPTMFARVIKLLDMRKDIEFPSLKAITLSSAPTSRSLLDRVIKAFPGVTVDVSYGSTEGGPTVFSGHADGRPKPPLALGVVAPGVRVELINGSQDEGVLVTNSPAVMAGYLNLPEKSGEVLREGWYYSGDVMRRDADGFYYFIGRADDMFVCSGENIYPGEVEKLLEGHPSVQQAAVVPLEDDERGQVPVAFIVPKTGASIDVADLRNFALANGPAYQHPRRVSIVSELPLAGTHKVDRAHLLQRARELERESRWST